MQPIMSGNILTEPRNTVETNINTPSNMERESFAGQD